MTGLSKSKIPGGYNRGFANWLRSNDVLMGEHSNFASLAAAIQKGGNQGNRGSKGCGMVRIEPFEEWANLRELHDAFSASSRYAVACRALTNWERWILCARYLMRRDALPVGLYAALDDLGGVAVLVAYRMGMLDEFTGLAGKDAFERWRGIAEVTSEKAHESLEAALADYDTELDAGCRL